MSKTKKAEPKKEEKNNDITLELIQRMTTLATSGFGLVAALAWNNVITEAVNSYIKPYIFRGSGVISLLIYAILITCLAVLVTWNLSVLERRFTDINHHIKKQIRSKTKKSTK